MALCKYSTGITNSIAVCLFSISVLNSQFYLDLCVTGVGLEAPVPRKMSVSENC